jgi:etoposide-induced 2.4 mRNA
MFIICTPINSIWFREIALETSDHLKTHKPKGNKLPKRSLTDVITDLIYGIIIEIIFSIQATFVNLIPVGGSLLSLIHFALLYSLYSFEYKWFYEGVNVKKRLLLIEQKWPYFLGFGITLSILTSTPLLSPFAGGRVALHHTIGDVILSTCIFALAFPMMILASFRTSSPQTCFYRIPIFKLSHLTCNKLFNFLKY